MTASVNPAADNKNPHQKPELRRLWSDEMRYPLLNSCFFVMALNLCVVPVSVHGMTELAEEELGELAGEGLAFPFENIRFQMAPTSFVEVTGVPFTSCTGGSAASPTPAGCLSFLKRGDLRYYGLTMSQGATYAGMGTGPNANKMTYNLSTANTMNWDRSACTGGFYGLGCPTSQYGINEYSTADNPFVLRAFDYNAMGYGGVNTNQTVLEFIGPSNMDPFRWSFWGEAEAGRTVDAGGNITGMTGLLKSQVLILGKAAARLRPPSQRGSDDVGASANPYAGPVLRIFQDGRTSSLGMTYASRLSGDFRFSVNQANDANDARGQVPTFTAVEGLYFRNVNAYLPLGQLNYQTITFDRRAAGDGNFVMELTAIPDTSAVYGAHYSLPATAAFTGCTTSACLDLNRGYNRGLSAVPAAYYQTHGYVEWGTDFPSCAQPNCMSGTNTANNFGSTARRFSGSSAVPAGSVTRTYTLASQQMVGGSENGDGTFNGGGYWSGDLCSGNDCDRFNAGTAPAVNFTVTSSWNAATLNGAVGTAQEIVDVGGFVFVARPGSTWQVYNNQNSADISGKLIQMENDTDVKVARSQSSQDGIFSCGASRCWRLAVRATPDQTAIQNRANAIFTNDPNDNGRALITMNAINLGASRVSGMIINSMKITSLGAN